MARRSIAQSKEQGDSTPLFLSLYLIVLAFFILLNAISKIQEERTKVVFGSLGATFAEPAIVATGPLDFTAGSGAYSAVHAFDESIRSLFQSAFPFVSFKPFQPFEKMVAEVPVNAMFGAKGALIRADHVVFLNELAAILSRETPGQRFSVELLLPVSPGAVRSPTPERSVAVDRASVLARALVVRGVPADSITAGIEGGDPGRLRMRFDFQPTERAADAPESESP
jgi:hypothetical protein